MKHIITCICLMFAAGVMAQTTPMSSSEARKVNMSRINGKAAINNDTQIATDSNSGDAVKSHIGVSTVAVDGGLEINGFDSGNSTARAAKLKVGDIITFVNSKPIATRAELDAAIQTYEPGDVVTISYTRGIRKLTKEVRLNRK